MTASCSQQTSEGTFIIQTELLNYLALYTRNTIRGTSSVFVKEHTISGVLIESRRWTPHGVVLNLLQSSTVLNLKCGPCWRNHVKRLIIR